MQREYVDMKLQYDELGFNNNYLLSKLAMQKL